MRGRLRRMYGQSLTSAAESGYHNACGNCDRQNGCRVSSSGTGPWKPAVRKVFNKLIKLLQAHALRCLVTRLPNPFLVLHVA